MAKEIRLQFTPAKPGTLTGRNACKQQKPTP
jgi:hypothetical protein